jgi:uncharacterized protein (DUF1697 family)
MARYAAFLRGVSPVNAKMAELIAAFEAAGFADVKTVASSGNVVFDARPSSDAALQTKAEAAMQKRLGRSFLTFIRPIDTLKTLLASDPYRGFKLKPGSKRIVTFLRESPKEEPKLPVELHGARVLRRKGTEVFTVYVATPYGPVFMTLIERTLGKDVTTRTWEALTKIVAR